jgi:hypothetical protein
MYLRLQLAFQLRVIPVLGASSALALPARGLRLQWRGYLRAFHGHGLVGDRILPLLVVRLVKVTPCYIRNDHVHQLADAPRDISKRVVSRNQLLVVDKAGVIAHQLARGALDEVGARHLKVQHLL